MGPTHKPAQRHASARARAPLGACQAGPRVSRTFPARSTLARSPVRSLTLRPHLSVPPSPTRPRPTAPANLAGITPIHAFPRSSATSFKRTLTPPCISPLHPAAATATLAPPPPRSALCRRAGLCAAMATLLRRTPSPADPASVPPWHQEAPRRHHPRPRPVYAPDFTRTRRSR